ncbi:MAG: hypothetical protein ABF916_08635, partial [Acetobacter fabarum]|uniref:hypothetical protein n=1 Tax=Acetobacter fabarum TaxID=483199 RepID=UPI0039E886A5
MTKLKADFFADWVELLRAHLIDVQKWPSTEILELSDTDISHYFFDAQLRCIASIPRVIEIGDSFSCSPAHEAGWAMLQEKVRKGEDINSYLSKKHASLHNHDGLLAEWGVHHFHLGAAPCPKNPAYMDRTGPLLYAIVGDEVFYAINVYDHQSFEKTDVIESIHRNWPEMVRCYRMKGASTGSVWGEEKRKALRKINVNLTTTVA